MVQAVPGRIGPSEGAVDSMARLEGRRDGREDIGIVLGLEAGGEGAGLEGDGQTVVPLQVDGGFQGTTDVELLLGQLVVGDDQTRAGGIVPSSAPGVTVIGPTVFGGIFVNMGEQEQGAVVGFDKTPQPLDEAADLAAGVLITIVGIAGVVDDDEVRPVDGGGDGFPSCGLEQAARTVIVDLAGQGAVLGEIK